MRFEQDESRLAGESPGSACEHAVIGLDFIKVSPVIKALRSGLCVCRS
jgi:hypothetical protein